MTEVGRIVDQMRRAYERDAWCGSSLREALAGVTAECAAARPLENAHSIWEVVRHVAAWKNVVRRRLGGEQVRLPEEGDWPVVAESGAEAWQAALDALGRRQAELMDVVAKLSDDKLDEVLMTEQSRESGGGVSIYITLHGTAQHDLYHAAQIAMLKKSCAER